MIAFKNTGADLQITRDRANTGRRGEERKREEKRSMNGWMDGVGGCKCLAYYKYYIDYYFYAL